MSESPASAAAPPGDAPARLPLLVILLGALHVAVGALGLLGALIFGLRWFGIAGEPSVLTRLVAENGIVRAWLRASLALTAGAAGVLLAAGLGLWRSRRWALKMSFFYAVASLGTLGLGSIILLSHFGNILHGPTGLTKAAFEVTLSHPSSTNVTVDFAALSGTAAAGSDFAATNGTLTIKAGRTKQTILVSVQGDSLAEAGTEDFTVILSNAVHAVLAGAEARGAITDDDGLPAVAIGDVQMRERDRGVVEARLAVTLSHASSSNVTVRYATVDGTARAGADFEAGSGTVTVPAWRTNGLITVRVYGDTEQEGGAEQFAVLLSEARNATIADPEGQVTIVDDDGVPALFISDAEATERAGKAVPAVFRVTLSHKTAAAVEATYATADGTAAAGPDFEATRGTLTIPAWRTNTTVAVRVLGDGEAEADTETFTLVLSDPVNAVLGDGEGLGTIRDADALPTLAIGDVNVAKGYGRRPEAVFGVTLSRAVGARVTVDYATADGTAVEGPDYKAAQGTLTIPKGETNGSIRVEVRGEGTGEEESRQFTVNLAGAVNAVIADAEGVCTITRPTLSIKGVSVVEGDPADKPEILALRRMVEAGTRAGGILFLLCPLVILVLVSRRSVLAPFGIDVRSSAFTAGTLTYTKIGLTALFAWLLWGDFCFTIMNAVVPTVLPLKLKALGASNVMISVILSTLPSILNLTVCPWVSFKSDRYRSRWGRRIPFIVWTMPFLTLSLVMLGWSEDIGGWLRGAVPAFQGVAPNTMAVVLIATFLVVFQFFNLFVNSVFWYLFNDVVPPQFLGRFMGLFRIAGTAASALYQWYVFQYAETNMREILTGGALLYFFGFALTCWRVKEGEYPPITGEDTYKRKGLLTDIKIFAKESFTVRFYWYFFIVGGVSRIAYALGMFNVFFSKQMGLTLQQMGKLHAVSSIVGIIATYFTAALVDRWHPLRILTYQKLFTAVMGFAPWIWVLMTLPGDLYFWMGMVGTVIAAFDYVLDDAAGIPCMMRIMPKSRYGQFSSANAMIRSLATIGAGVVAGLYMDFLKWMCNGSDYAYRWMWTWIWPFNIIACVFLVRAYQEWKLRGGDEHYRPPAPWDPSGFEEVADKVKSHPGKPRIVMVSLGIGAACSVVNILLVGVFMAFMYRQNMMWSFGWYAKVFLPIKAVLLGLFLWQIWSINRDITTLERGGTPRYGIPHYGVILVETATGLLMFSVYWLQMTWMIGIELERELIICGINTLIATFAHSLVATHILRVIERVQAPALPPAAPAPSKPAA